MNEAGRQVCLFIFLRHTREKRTRGEGEGRAYSDQQTGVIEVKPTVKIQSASGSPGIPTTPRSVVEVPIPASNFLQVFYLQISSNGKSDEIQRK
jgi:hypothetical protein